MYRVFNFIGIILLLAVGSVHAHSGGTDANGGHYNHKTGEYHSHNSSGMDVLFILLGLVILFVVIPIILKYLKGDSGERKSQHSKDRLTHKRTIDLHSTPPPPISHTTRQPFDYQARWWRERSTWYRNEKGWTCEECQICLESDPQYLHTHHIYGTQHNDPKYLKALCIACHSEKPGEHRRLKQEPDYQAFMRKYGQEWRLSMRKKDDGQWAQNLANHKSPFYQPKEKNTEAPDTARTSKGKYKFEGQPLTPDIVETILLQWSMRAGSPEFTIREAAKCMRAYHEASGGLPMQGEVGTDLVNIVGTSLISLQRKGRARQKFSRYNSIGIWKIG